VSVAVLVPRRADGGHRDRLWDYCRAWWESEYPGWEIVEGGDIGDPFSRSASINDAARRTSADVLVIADSDVIPPEVGAGVKVAAETGRAVLPFGQRVELNQRATGMVLDGFNGRWDVRQNVAHTWADHVSSCVVVPRALFDRVGGFDERFVGWSPEDRQFHHACRTLGGGVVRLPGIVFHLWHETSLRKKTTPEWLAGNAMWNRQGGIVDPGALASELAVRERPGGVLVVFVSNGRTDCLPRAIESFGEHLAGDIAARIVVDDSGDPDWHALIRHRWPDIEVCPTKGGTGFGGAYRRVWAEIAARGVPWAFVIEEDFVATRPVDLGAMQAVMDDRPNLVQMALRRQAWFPGELAVGGVIELNPDGYTDHDEHLEHREFVTTNPSLWRHEFVARHPWPKKPHSEAVFAREVFANPDAVSGYWGARGDDPWVIHDGERTGSGY